MGIPRIYPWGGCQDRSWEFNFKSLEEIVKKFEEASGLNIKYGWHRPEKIGETVRAILEGKNTIEKLLNSAKWGVKQAEQNKEALQGYVDILEKVLSVDNPEGQA